MKNLLIIIFLPFIFGCTSRQPPGWKELNLGEFTISMPEQWKQVLPNDQEDSFVGQIAGPNDTLYFDCSGMGYANHLIPSVNEYLNSRDWMGFDLINSNVFPIHSAKKDFHTPTTEEKMKYPKADYIAIISYEGKNLIVPITIPIELKTHYIQVDSDTKFVYKTIWPKIPGKGMTGIYIHSRHTTFNFQLSSRDLTLQDQELALQAFKTIKFKNK